MKGTLPGLNSLQNELIDQGLYLYGKTGTIGDSSGPDDKNLVLVISKKPLHNGNVRSAEELRSNRFVVMYFHFKREGNSQPIQLLRDSVKEVINSKRFKELMY